MDKLLISDDLYEFYEYNIVKNLSHVYKNVNKKKNIEIEYKNCNIKFDNSDIEDYEKYSHLIDEMYDETKIEKNKEKRVFCENCNNPNTQPATPA